MCCILGEGGVEKKKTCIHMLVGRVLMWSSGGISGLQL